MTDITKIKLKKKINRAGKVERDHNFKHGYVLTLWEKELLET